VELSRRDLLSSLLGAPFVAASLSSCGDDEAAPQTTGTILGPRMELGHALRDGEIQVDDFQGAPRRRVKTAILGGGPAGLAAAWRLARRGEEDFVVVDMEPAVGGTSRSGASDVTPYPWGAHYTPVPMAHQRDLTALLTEVGALDGVDDSGAPRGAEHVLVRAPDERLFEGGYWHRGLFPQVNASAEDREQLQRWLALVSRYVAMRDPEGRRAFVIPVDESSFDTAAKALDQMTAAELLERHGITSPRVRWWVEYGCRDDYGLTLESTSAWAAIFYTAARTAEAGGESQDFLAWPEGNGALVAHLARSAGETRLLTGRMVVDVEPHEDRVFVRTLAEVGQDPLVIEADRVVVAMPRFIARHVVRPLREQRDPNPFTHGAWLVANLHLDGRPHERGAQPAWDNVIYDSPALGYVSATHQRGRDFGSTVWTYYLPFTDDDAAAGRRRLLEPSWADWKELIVRDLSRAHGNLAAHLRRLDVFRWGHAMVQPRVGVITGDARRRARQPLGRLHFAHSELSGVAIFEEAFHHGVRAADEVLAAAEADPNRTPSDAAPSGVAPRGAPG